MSHDFGPKSDVDLSSTNVLIYIKIPIKIKKKLSITVKSFRKFFVTFDEFFYRQDVPSPSSRPTTLSKLSDRIMFLAEKGLVVEISHRRNGPWRRWRRGWCVPDSCHSIPDTTRVLVPINEWTCPTQTLPV